VSETKNKRVFLLGGHDLEMLEIKKMLQEAGEIFLDKELSWGAPLSAYKDAFNDKDTFVGIELEEDISPPKHYVEIDHHGKNTHKLSSIEQVAELLDIKLNRWQKLVAANDARYISGLKQYCASDEEIEEIRLQDRAAQGVSKEDEKLAEKSIDEAGDSFVIYALTPYFSAIADRVYDKFTHYIIYNENTVVFYGFSIEKLLHFLSHKQISPKSYYYGGGEYGFLGIKKDFFTGDEIANIIKEFVLMNENDEKELKSYHTFMFPFTFEKKEFDKGNEWIYLPFKVEEARDYNEYVYFYKHVQEALFSDKEESESSISRYYEYKKQEGSFTIDTEMGRFELELDGISLRIFNTDVAILSFNLINKKYGMQKDILAINDFGRRIYPQFLGKDFSLEDTKKAFLVNEIILRFADGEVLREDFCSFSSKENLQTQELSLLPKYILNLINKNFKEPKKLRPIIDDRMFVISQYNSDAMSESLKRYDAKDGYAYEYDDFWYKYVFVDGKDKTCHSRYMSKELIKNSTYDRWVEWGTLFGVSRYSFVSLTGSWYGKKILLPHMQTIYFQIFTLLLAYRATIIKFSDEIQNVTEQEEDKLATETQKIYKKYLNFLNKLYFKEVTAQDQGIELYNKAMKIMDIPKYMKDLDNEINELHSYVDMQEEKKTSEKMNTLTWIGGVLLPPSLLTGFFGMNTVKNWQLMENEIDGGVSVVLVIASAFVIPVILSIINFLKKENHE